MKASAFILAALLAIHDATAQVAELELPQARRVVAAENVCAWPNLTLLGDGTVAAVLHNQPAHGQREGDVECWASRDGLKWEKRSVVTQHEPHTIRMNHAAGLAKNGDLLVLCSGWTDVKQPERPKQSAFRDAVLRPWVMRSSDGGRTWTKRDDFPAGDDGWTEHIPFGDIWAGDDGALHASCYQGKLAEPAVSTRTSAWRSWHLRSDDDGATWRRVSLIGPAHNETDILPLKGKNWLLTAILLAPVAAQAAPPFHRVEVARIEQTGKAPPEAAGAKVLANEPDGGVCGLRLEFDLEAVAQRRAPMARLQLGELEKLKLKRPGQKPGGGRGAVHVFFDGDVLTGSTCVKPAGIPTAYSIDVTEAVSRTLAKAAGQRHVTLELRMTGLPAAYEAYALRQGPPALEIAPDTDWTEDAEARLRPLWKGNAVYRESLLPLTKDRNAEMSLPLLYRATRITEVIANATGERLLEGRDWLLREGQLVLPAGTRAPVQLEDEFFTAERKEKDGSIRKHKTSVRLVEGTWYHERQIEVSYETAAKDLPMPAPRSSLADLPKLRAKLAAKSPVSIVLFGDSIATGGNASKFQGAWPWQPAFGELVAHELERRHGSRVTLMNHSRGGATSDFGTTQAESQVAWFKPDLAILAYGMNDRSPERQQRHRANLENIIATVRATSPDTEFLIVTPMMNNPIPGGHAPILAIRDAALSIHQPGVAHADVTSAHQAILRRKAFLDTTGNGSNHPNDFLHRVYAMRILEVLAP